MLFFSAMLVGFSLGLMGAGGSIIAVPILMLLMEMSEKVAIKHALIIVGMISLVGAINGLRKNLIDAKVLTYFALSSLPLASVGALVGHALPNGWQTAILVALMLISAFKMVASKTLDSNTQKSLLIVLISGGIAGFVTGLVGIGGGFLIVPALVLYAGLNMQQAVANSLVLIAINAAAAFVTLNIAIDSLPTDWLVVSVMSISGVIAVVGGQLIAAKINQQILKRGFAICLLGVSVALLVNQF